MVRLISSGGDFVEIGIDGYQFGSSSPDGRGDWDANWLNISGRVNHTGETWKFRDPCLTTWEAKELLRFLRKPHQKVGDAIEFTEPNLSVKATAKNQDTVTMTLTFRAEAAPPDMSHDDRWDGGRPVELTLSRDALNAASDEWASELKAYPER